MTDVNVGDLASAWCTAQLPEGTCYVEDSSDGKAELSVEGKSFHIVCNANGQCTEVGARNEKVQTAMAAIDVGGAIKDVLDAARSAIAALGAGGAAAAAGGEGDSDGGSGSEYDFSDAGSGDSDDSDGRYDAYDDEMKAADAASSGGGKRRKADPSADDFFTGKGTPAATQRLCKELGDIMESKTDQFGFSAEPDGDNLYKWKIELFNFEKDSLLGKDLEAYAARTGGKPAITMEMKFPSDYPMAPPFVRVVKPRFAFLTGHVTVGGSVCMQVLTNSGWTPTNSVEGVIVQVRAEIASDPKAQLDKARADVPYNEHEAKQAFDRMVHKYGWNA